VQGARKKRHSRKIHRSLGAPGRRQNAHKQPTARLTRGHRNSRGFVSTAKGEKDPRNDRAEKDTEETVSNFDDKLQKLNPASQKPTRVVWTPSFHKLEVRSCPDVKR